MLPATARADSNCTITQDRSLTGETMTAIDFVNRSGVTVEIYWLDYGGRRVLYNTLLDGARYVQSTWLTHPWVAIDAATGTCLGYTISDVAAKDYVVLPENTDGRILFASTRFTPAYAAAPLSQLMAMAPDGSGQTRLASTDSFDANPSPSPDGRRIAFDRRIGGLTQLVVADADGSNERQLTFGEWNSSNPSWSPDGMKLAFQSDPFGRDEIDTISADGGAPVQIAIDGDAQNIDPSWSPDGTTIVYSSCGVYETCELETVGAGGGDDSGTDLGLTGRDPVFSPGGTRLAFIGAGSDVWVANSDGSGAIDLTGDDGPDASPTWSPDGSRIAYAWDRAGTFDVYVVPSSPTETPAVQLTTDPADDTQPAWGIDPRRADLASSLACSTPCPASLGAQVLFTGSVSNHGPDAAAFAHAAISLSSSSASFTFDAASAGGETCNVSENVADCDLGTLAAEGSVPVTVRATVTSGVEFPAILEAAIHASSATRDPESENNDAVADVTIVSPAVISNVSVAVDPATSEPGAREIPTANVDLSALTKTTGSTASAPLASIPIASIPIASIPIASIPLASIGLTPSLLDAIGGVPLSTLPLKTPGGWPARLSEPLASAMLQTVTLADVLRQAPTAVNGLTLQDLGIASSPIASIPIASIALGPLRLADLPLLAHTGDQNLDDWCAALARATFSCASRVLGDGTAVGNATVLSIGIQGAPLASIPLASIPIASIPLASIPIASIPIASIAVAGSPIASIPIASIAVAGSPIASIPIASIPIASIGNVVDCSRGYPCATKTLGDALIDHRILPGAKLSDLGNAILSTLTLAQLGPFFPANITLGDLLAALMGPPSGRGYEQLPFTQLPAPDWASAGGSASYHVAFTLTGGPSPGGAAVELIPPPGYRYGGGVTLVDFPTEGASTSSVPGAPEQAAGKLTFHVFGLVPGHSYRLDFVLRPSLLLGDGGPTVATVTPDSAGTPGSNFGAHLIVHDTFEPADNDPATAPALAADTIYLSYITSATDLDTFRFPAPAAGSRVTVKVVPPPGADYDLSVYRPTRSSVLSSPIASIPLDGQPVPDAGLPLSHAASTQAPETLADVPIASIPIASISDNRGSAEETATAVVQSGDAGHDLRIDVSGYQGSTSAKPYTLLVTVTPPPNLAACDPSPIASNGVAALGVLPDPATTPATLNSLFVVDSARLSAAYGSAAAQSVLASLSTLAGRADLGVVGTVVDVARDATVRAAEIPWNANPCLPDNANAVASAVSSVIARYRAARTASLKYIVFAGGDDQIPFFRLPDVATVSNESDYAVTFLDHANQYFGSLASGDVLSDNPYGTPNPTPFLDRYLYVPSLSVGRLVETPADIVRAVSQFVTSSGTLAPSTALVTGYDFLADGSQRVAATETAQHGATNVRSLIDDPATLPTPPWTAASLDAALGLAPAKVLSLNAHYDHYRLLPSDRGALFSSAQMAAKTLSGRFVFTMGCHAGLGVSDIVVGASDARRLDWAQVYGAGGALFAGNTGFGYGDTTGVAYSEKLMAMLAARLDGSMTAGDALTFAKNDFKASLGPLDVYDEKVLSEATYYGLPMYRVGAAAALPPTPAPRPTAPAPGIGSGVVSADLSVSPPLTPKSSPFGSYYLSDDTTSVSYRPVEPSTSADVTEPGLIAHGALVTQLASTDFPNFDAAFSMPTIDRTVLAPEPVFADAVFPTKLQTVQTFADPRGQRQRLVLVVGQFASDPELASGRGRQRNFTQVGARVYYTPVASTDFTPAQFGLIQGAQIGTQAAFSVHASDTGGTGVKRILVGYHDGNQWKFVDLTQSASDATLWTGGAPSGTTNPEFFVQAVDGAGNVSVTSYKGRYYLAPPAPAPSDTVSWTLTGTAGLAGWFTSSVAVSVTAPDGSTIDLDGGPFTLGSPVSVSGDGVHLLGIRVGDAVTRVPVPIDASAPTITITSPAGGAAPSYGDGTKLRFSCADTGSGITSCSATLNGNPANDGADISSTVGPRTVTVTAIDAAGNRATKTISFEVHWLFNGFLFPIKNPPVVNRIVPGWIIPMRFGLGGNRGLGIIAAGFPTLVTTACPSAVPADVLETMSATGSSLFLYIPLIQQYLYIWKSPTAWPSGQCRTWTLKLIDGTTHAAIFKAR